MWKFDWTEAMSVSVDELDEDHKRTVRLLNSVGAAAVSADFTSVDTFTDMLLADLDWHFRREERILRKYGYPALAKHMAGHVAALDHGREFRKLVSERHLVSILTRLDDLRLFFVERLIIEDLDYKWFFLDRNIVPEFDEPANRESAPPLIR